MKTDWRVMKTGWSCFLPGIIGILALVGFLEILFHFKHAAQGDTELGLFGLVLNTHSVLPWLICVVLMVIGFFFARRYAPELKEAWDEANTVPVGEGR